ncbi:hypothetical protein [Terracoccus sp. 273MFTsu3.1]|uniref:hypothetical protein n=1 Tax=Terracoccus sp. 273MFTsu3.1 TaxID=1172188 RepID=UPI0012DE9E2D|nr:hypothetical protein [Terracoccus sp. 273MFTsu3.1]
MHIFDDYKGSRMNSFSWLAAFGGAVGVLWLEIVRVGAKARSGRRLWSGLRLWQYALLAGSFMFVAFVFAGFAVTGFVSAVFIGFGIEGGPVATGILANPQGKLPSVEDGAGNSRERGGVGTFFTEP